MAVGVGHHLPHNRIRPTTHRQRHETRIAAVGTFGPDTKRQVLTPSVGAMNFMRAVAARARPFYEVETNAELFAAMLEERA